MARHFVHRMLFAYVLASAFLGCFHKSAEAAIVCDPWNYTQNYIRTLRALQKINNQVKAIQGIVTLPSRKRQVLRIEAEQERLSWSPFPAAVIQVTVWMYDRL